MDYRTIFFVAILCGVMPSSTNCQVDYFKLALQWTGAYHNQCGDDGLAHFSIHGLWQEPRLPQGQLSDDPLDLTEIGPLIVNMELMWPSLRSPRNNMMFWEHEWQSHGAYSNLPQSEYFGRTVKLTQRVQGNLLLVLRENNMQPSPLRRYPTRSFVNVLRTHIRGFSGIKCGEHDELSEIYICVDRTASDFVMCPETPSNCGHAILFPEYNNRRAGPFPVRNLGSNSRHSRSNYRDSPYRHPCPGGGTEHLIRGLVPVRNLQHTLRHSWSNYWDSPYRHPCPGGGREQLIRGPCPVRNLRDNSRSNYRDSPYRF